MEVPFRVETNPPRSRGSVKVEVPTVGYAIQQVHSGQLFGAGEHGGYFVDRNWTGSTTTTGLSWMRQRFGGDCRRFHVQLRKRAPTRNRRRWVGRRDCGSRRGAGLIRRQRQKGAIMEHHWNRSL